MNLRQRIWWWRYWRTWNRKWARAVKMDRPWPVKERS